MTDDWLDIGEPTPNLPAVVELPNTYGERLALLTECWERLTPNQKTFLTALRENRFNARNTARKLGVARSGHKSWMHKPDYLTVFKIWQAIAGGDAIDRDRLLVRQDDIVEQLLKPKPILFQGSPTGHYEIEGSAAARANETLMKAAGMLKDKDVEINVGIIGPALTIQVVSVEGKVTEVTQGVAVELAPPDAIEAEFSEIPSGD